MRHTLKLQNFKALRFRINGSQPRKKYFFAIKPAVVPTHVRLRLELVNFFCKHIRSTLLYENGTIPLSLPSHSFYKMNIDHLQNITLFDPHVSR